MDLASPTHLLLPRIRQGILVLRADLPSVTVRSFQFLELYIWEFVHQVLLLQSGSFDLIELSLWREVWSYTAHREGCLLWWFLGTAMSYRVCALHIRVCDEIFTARFIVIQQPKNMVVPTLLSEDVFKRRSVWLQAYAFSISIVPGDSAGLERGGHRFRENRLNPWPQYLQQG